MLVARLPVTRDRWMPRRAHRASRPRRESGRRRPHCAGRQRLGQIETTFRLERSAWRATGLAIRMLTMTTLDRGWAVPDKVMMPFERRG
jgi:hypothetical protein